MHAFKFCRPGAKYAMRRGASISKSDSTKKKNEHTSAKSFFLAPAHEIAASGITNESSSNPRIAFKSFGNFFFSPGKTLEKSLEFLFSFQLTISPSEASVRSNDANQGCKKRVSPSPNCTLASEEYGPEKSPS